MVMLSGAPVFPAKMLTVVETPESIDFSVPLVNLKYMIAPSPDSRPTGPVAELAHTNSPGDMLISITDVTVQDVSITVLTNNPSTLDHPEKFIAC